MKTTCQRVLFLSAFKLDSISLQTQLQKSMQCMCMLPLHLKISEYMIEKSVWKYQRLIYNFTSKFKRADVIVEAFHFIFWKQRICISNVFSWWIFVCRQFLCTLEEKYRSYNIHVALIDKTMNNALEISQSVLFYSLDLVLMSKIRDRPGAGSVIRYPIASLKRFIISARGFTSSNFSKKELKQTNKPSIMYTRGKINIMSWCF